MTIKQPTDDTVEIVANITASQVHSGQCSIRDEQGNDFRPVLTEACALLDIEPGDFVVLRICKLKETP